MKLRARLALTAVATLCPVVVALLYYDALVQHGVAHERLVGFTKAHFENAQAECEADPGHWGDRHDPPPPRDHRFPPQHGPHPPPPGVFSSNAGPPRPPFNGPPPRAEPARLFVYDESFHSSNPHAPALSPALVEAIAGNPEAQPSFVWPSSRVETLLRMPWASRSCAYVLARGTTDPSWGSVLPENPMWLAPVFAVLVAVLAAVGPVVERIRRLTEAVARSAAHGYRTDVAEKLHESTDEIGALANAFDAASRQVREALAEKEAREKSLRDFVSNTTHDVMVPLSVLQGHLMTLREQTVGDASVVISAMTEAHYLGSLIHNLAVAARIESTHVTLHRTAVNLEELIRRVVARHRPVAKQLEVSLDYAVPDEPVEISADVTLIEQAISNVTHNAVRYNHPGGHVVLLLECRGEDGFLLRIADDGPGIEPVQLTRLVERGYRGDQARTRAPDGQGLGLHIAFRAAELHGYDMKLGPSEFGGLEVSFEGLKR